jgi:hypothetical protein|nr:MAG TPA: hypothetical protein [Caudoviricetes sp.]
MTIDEQLRDALERRINGAKQAQLRWVTVDTVDKDNRAMDVTGVVDQLEYYNVQLGMGALCIYPKPGTTCLVGIIEGQETDAFLISAEEVDEIVLNGGTLGGLVKVGELTDRLNLIEKDINSLKQKLSGWTPVPNDGGSALKAALSSYFTESLQETQVKDIENERVKQ